MLQSICCIVLFLLTSCNFIAITTHITNACIFDANINILSLRCSFWQVGAQGIAGIIIRDRNAYLCPLKLSYCSNAYNLILMDYFYMHEWILRPQDTTRSTWDNLSTCKSSFCSCSLNLIKIYSSVSWNRVSRATSPTMTAQLSFRYSYIFGSLMPPLEMTHFCANLL